MAHSFLLPQAYISLEGKIVVYLYQSSKTFIYYQMWEEGLLPLKAAALN